MTRIMRGPAIFLAQFAGNAAPFDNLDRIAGWAAALGYKGVQIPSWDRRLFDLDRAADSDAYCDEVKSTLASNLPTCPPICRASSSRCIRPMTKPLTDSHQPPCRANHRHDRHGRLINL